MKRYRLTIWFVVTALLSIAAASWGVGNIVRKESEANINSLTKEDAASDITLLRSYLESLREVASAAGSETVSTVDDRDIAVLGLLASGSAHDLNNTLSPILGYSDLMLNHPTLLDDRVDIRRMLQLINTSAIDASEVIARTRQFYKILADEATFESLDLNDLVRQVVDLTKPNLQNQATGIEIDVVTELSDVPTIQASASEIREILINMVINAADAMPEGGTIALRTRPAGRNIDIEVEDTGTGMSDETRGQCFNLFFSTKGERGNGLGLGVMQGTVRRHGRVITVESELGKGTTFKVR